MKIRKVEATHVAIPYQHGRPLSVFGIDTTRATMNSVYIRVDTEEGVTGWGEASPLGDMIYPCGGYFAVPDGPGLGIEVDEKILQRYRVN